MATIKFTEESPYKSEGRREHRTDFKYTKYLEDNGSIARSSPKTQNKMTSINVALFGLGRAGSIHLANVIMNPKINLLYVVEFDSKKAKRFQQLYDLSDSVLITSEESHKVFDDPRVHGLIIATPTITHEELVTQGLNAGKAIFCEKPISQDIEGTKRCYALAEQVGKPLFCAFNRRYDPAFEEVYSQVRSGNVGRVHLIKTIARDSPLPCIDYLKISGGIFHDCAVHDIDLICWILGEYPVEVFAAGTAFIPEIGEINDLDTVAITLKFESGTLGMIDLSRNAVYGYDQRLEVFGHKGMLAAANEKPMQVTLSTLSSESQPPVYHSFPSRYQVGYIRELLIFCDLIQGNSAEIVTGENTLKIAKIADALHESIKKKRLITVQY